MTTTPKAEFGTHLADIAAFLAVVLILLWPSLWNGYPLIYHDTEDYVNTSFTWQVMPWRTVPYAVLVGLGRLTGGLWSVVVVQAALAAWVLQAAVAAFAGGRRGVLLGAAVLLALGSGLPWLASQVMPDILTGVAPLGLAVLAFGGGLRRPWRILLLIPIAVAIACHLSHLAAAAGLILALLALRLVTQWWRPSLRPALGLALAALLLGGGAFPVLHKLVIGEAVFSPSGKVLQLALFVQNGLAKRYLDKVCPTGSALKLCPYRDKLPATADAFLWAHWASPFWKLGGWVAMKDEARKIVAGATREFPGAVAWSALHNAGRQMVELRLGDGLDPKRRSQPGEYRDTGKARFPDEFAAYIGARQQTGKGIDFSLINAVQIPLAWIAQLALVLLLVDAARRRDDAGLGLAGIMLLAILGNAILCGALSNPHDRYQNRIVWLALAADAMLLVRLRQTRLRLARPSPAARPAGAVAQTA